MRADLISRIVSASRLTVFLLITLGLAACKTEKAADEPTILGIPPSTAYLGVEYYYNFGAYGGETILDYSLTNAPSWLALEDTSNKARQGIIMRGVPGLTGGNRGEDDLGKVRGVNLVTTDGQMMGAQPFDIEVKYNPLSLAAETFSEGESLGVDETRREHCEVPDLEASGEHSFTINEYAEDGSVAGTKEITVATRPVLVKVILDRPSVTRVAVAFELSSQYDASNCDTGFSAPHQRCDYSETNQGDAVLGQDIVALGSGSESALQGLAYLSYREDGLGGQVTFEPGITECYIRLEVVDDSFAEPTEAAKLVLTEVRSGLAGLGQNNEGVDVNLSVDDNEPAVSVRTLEGGKRDALSIDGEREYVGVLSGERNGTFRARLGNGENSEALLGEEFVIEQEQSEGVWVENEELVFPEAVDEVRFRIRVLTDTFTNPELNDLFTLVDVDEAYQVGRENYVRAAEEGPLRVSINELTSPLLLNSSDGFVATDLAIAHSGRAFVAGYNSLDSDRILVRIYDQKGGLLQEVALSGSGDVLNSPSPVISTVQRKVSEGAEKVDRFEFVVAYSTDAPVAGTSERGGEDVIITRYWFDEASNGGEYVPNWITRTGTDGDDRVRSVSIDAETGYVLITGETNGTWPQQSNAGGFDSFLQRIDTILDGNNEVPQIAWTRQVGSAANDSVAGGSVSSSSPLLFGSAQGAVNGEAVIGGIDAFFYRTSSAADNLSVYQVGTEGDDAVSDGVAVNSLLWLLGNSPGEYSVVSTGEGERALERTGLNSVAGFLLAYSSNGSISRAFTLNDPGDQSAEQFGAISLFGGDVVAGGSTNGAFAAENNSNLEQGILARVSLVDTEETDEEAPFKNEWQYQLPEDDSDLLALANYRDDEITALARRGTDFLLLVFSPEGKLLSALD